MALISHFPLPKRCTLQTLRILRRFCQMAWQGIEAPKQTSEFPAALSFFSSKKWIKLIPKTIGNRKRDCAWGCARRINTTWENLQIEKHKSERRLFRSPDWFVLFDLQIFSGGVYPPSATSRTISFSNSFWYYLTSNEFFYEFVVELYLSHVKRKGTLMTSAGICWELSRSKWWMLKSDTWLESDKKWHFLSKNAFRGKKELESFFFI